MKRGIFKIGGQSTRPGAKDVGAEEELCRVEPVLRAVFQNFPNVKVSIDTYRADVARAAIDRGVEIVNDVSAGTADKKLRGVVAEKSAAMVLMHMRGTPQTMQSMTGYGREGVTRTSANELKHHIDEAMACGIRRWSIIADAGIGFAKTAEQSVELLRNGKQFRSLVGEFPVLLGVSRKSWMKSAVKDYVHGRDWGTAGAVATAVALGGVDMVRVHDPRVADAVRTSDIICRKI